MQSVLENVRGMLASNTTHVIVAVNPEKVIAAQQNPGLLSALRNAALVIPDGIGVVAAARLLGKGHMARVPGSDLMPEICRLAAAEGNSVFLYGAKPEVVSQAAMLLQDRYPGLKVTGTQHGYVLEEDMHQLVDTINASGADILFVGLGSPRQELWMARYGERLCVRVCQGVGGTFDAICGYPRRAPQALQKLHLEWLYRLVSQRQRAHRQLALPRFASQVLRQLIMRKR
jgi:N-acetylglucosaminyldiphosphoundecaprenol N-acetyl-beta-D-mannosaminyltransferase